MLSFMIFFLDLSDLIFAKESIPLFDYNEYNIEKIFNFSVIHYYECVLIIISKTNCRLEIFDNNTFMITFYTIYK